MLVLVLVLVLVQARALQLYNTAIPASVQHLKSAWTRNPHKSLAGGWFLNLDTYYHYRPKTDF